MQTRSRQSVSISPSRFSRSTALMRLAGGHPQAVEATLRFLSSFQSAALPGWHGGVCIVAPLVA